MPDNLAPLPNYGTGSATRNVPGVSANPGMSPAWSPARAAVQQRYNASQLQQMYNQWRMQQAMQAAQQQNPLAAQGALNGAVSQASRPGTQTALPTGGGNFASQAISNALAAIAQGGYAGMPQPNALGSPVPTQGNATPSLPGTAFRGLGGGLPTLPPLPPAASATAQVARPPVNSFQNLTPAGLQTAMNESATIPGAGGISAGTGMASRGAETSLPASGGTSGATTGTGGMTREPGAGITTGTGTATREPPVQTPPATPPVALHLRDDVAKRLYDRIRQIDPTFNPPVGWTLAQYQAALTAAQNRGQTPPPAETTSAGTGPLQPTYGPAEKRMIDRIHQLEPQFSANPGMSLTDLTAYYNMLATRGNTPTAPPPAVQTSPPATWVNPNINNVPGGTFRPQWDQSQPALYGFDPGLVRSIQQIDPGFQAPLGATTDYLMHYLRNLQQARPPAPVAAAAAPVAAAAPAGDYWSYFGAGAPGGGGGGFTSPPPARR